MSAAIPHHVFDAYVLFKQCEIVKLNPKVLGNLKTALRKYVLPSYGFETDTLQTDRGLEEALRKVTLKAFLDAPERLRDAIPASLSPGTFANYRSAINRFLGWMENHSWFNEESFQSFFFPICEAMVAKHFDVADDRCTADVGLNELPQRFVLGLGGIDDDVAVEEHQPSRPGKGRSWRPSRCQAIGSTPAKAFISASFSRAAAIAVPRSVGGLASGRNTVM